MKTFDYTITDPQGIHARPAGELVKEAKNFESSVQIGKAGKYMDCKKIFGIMGLAIKKDETVTFQIEGNDEDAATEAIEAFMKATL